MRKVLLGIVLGTIGTHLAYLAFRTDPASTQLTDTVSPQIPSERTPVPEELPIEAINVAAGESAGESNASEPQQLASAELLPIMTESLQPEEVLGSEEATAQRLRNGAARSLASMLNEPSIDGWATSAQAVLVDYVARQAELTQFGFPDVWCGAARCEIKLVAAGANDLRPEDWIQLLREGAGDYPWTESWVVTGFYAQEQDGAGATTVSWYLSTEDATSDAERLFVLSSVL